ncbi:hypothetical protein C4203_01390 [Clostridioides difficile]|nr:hypothetical protein [Clostridioides difficile]MDB3475616.1 hypothetical protein [Clostridioides difficile]
MIKILYSIKKIDKSGEKKMEDKKEVLTLKVSIEIDEELLNQKMSKIKGLYEELKSELNSFSDSDLIKVR